MIVIGIAGGTGSGKTTVVNEIIKRLPENDIAIIPQDAYYRDSSNIPPEDRHRINFDHPDSIEFDLLVNHIEQLQNGQAIKQPVYSYLTCSRLEETVMVAPRHIVIVEGILCLTNQKLRSLMDIKVFVDCEADLRLSRVITRDIVERERSVSETLKRYEETVRPMHLQFIEPSKRYADIIVPQGGKNKVAIDILTQYIEKQLSEK
ncbi:MAG: uridine kinase [Prolixibacteraceae bacterium]|nr:uridine kinase [Prolixibacteraceae bacterium]